MPEIQGEGLDVSAEEERYLKRVFRRFALPYLLVTLAFAVFAVSGAVFAPVASDDATADELETLVAEAASLRDALAAVRKELESSSSDATARLDELDQGVAQLRTEARGGDDAALASRVDHAHQRINALEGRLEKLQTEQVARSVPKPAPQAPPTYAPAPPPSRPSEPGAASPAWP